MSRVVLVHWRPEEAEAAIDRLRKAGFDVDCIAPMSSADMHRLREPLPSALVVDLSRQPSHGKGVAYEWRRNKKTRVAPLVFLGGEPEKVDAVRAMFPDAAYTELEDLAGAVRRAIRTAPDDPVVPVSTSGYSGKPLPDKLGIKADGEFLLLDEPQGFERKIGMKQGRAPVRRVLLFVRSEADLKKHFARACKAMAEGGGLWIVYPKKTSGIECDLTQQAIREFGMARDWVDYKICAVDETWTGMCFARRSGRRLTSK
jgi:hypothetical protein